MKRWEYYSGHLFDFRGTPPQPDWFVREVDESTDKRCGWHANVIAVVKSEADAKEIVDSHNRLVDKGDKP